MRHWEGHSVPVFRSGCKPETRTSISVISVATLHFGAMGEIEGMNKNGAWSRNPDTLASFLRNS